MISFVQKSIRQLVERPSEHLEVGPVKLVVIQPTTFCNLDCDYCYLPDRHLKLKFSLDLLNPLFEKLFKSDLVDKGFTVVWHAGEPLTMPVEFYEEAFSRIEKINTQLNAEPVKIRHGIQTNGTLINDGWCDLFNRYHVNVGISLDGPAFLHDAHRITRKGLGTHSGVMRGVKLLQENGIGLHVIAVLTSASLDYPDEIFDFFVESGIRHVGFNVDEEEGANETSSLEGDEALARYRAFMTRLLELTKQNPEALKIREFEQTRSIIVGKADITKGQHVPFTMLNVSYSGDISTFSPELLSMKSSVYGDFVFGNVLQDSFELIYKTQKFQQINSDIQKGVELCKSQCQYFSVCGGGAPSNKYFENGSFNSAETMYCKFSKQILTDIILHDLEQGLGLVNNFLD
ncbi:cyclophane-forming radical SAM/SPASM peptide maturase GrrM/OscB [Leptothoe sp. EHU-05/26/07-4]